MTPEAAVAHLVEVVAPRAELTGDDVYAAMAEAGVPDLEADRAIKFAQIAWGRVFLDGLGVRFSPDYLCFDGAGEVVESGRLSDQPYYAAAVAAAPNAARSPGFTQLALMSAEVNAVNTALNAGSSPEDLDAGPPALFMEPPTEEGMEKAKRVLAQRASAPAREGKAAGAKKPWWRVW